MSEKAHVPYSHKYLQPGHSSSSEFLKEIEIAVPVGELYALKTSCSYSNDMDFCPVIFEIKDEWLRE